MRTASLALLAFLLPLAVFAAGGREDRLVVAAIQFRVDASMLGSAASYERAIRTAVAEATRGRPVDLIVFPEYTAAFFALAGIGDRLARAATAEGLLASLRASDPAVRAPADFFALQADQTVGWIRESFGAIARERRAWVVAGTYFAPDGKGGLRNRAVVFSPDGDIAYAQDKVFPTEVEEHLLRMSGGSLEDAAGFRIRDREVRLTVCKDTFEPAWEERYRGAELWIDIKANGAAFTAEERASFGRALPARLGPAGVRYGLTVCLTGTLLEFVWEGESSFVASGPYGTTTLEATESPAAGASLIVTVPPKKTQP